jgi:N-acyl homoserine lactone hydrolase
MANLDILTYGFSFTSDQGGFGWSTISLLTVGNRHLLIDTGPASRRGLLQQALQGRKLGFEDIDTVILTHLHWDHCQNTDLFKNARILLHPKELDYARNPRRGDTSAAWYIADMLGKMKTEPVSDGDEVAEGISIVDTPGHTKGHISVLVNAGDTVLVAGDALPDSGTVKRGMPYNIFWDVKDATASVEKMLASSNVFYPGHDRPFRLDGDQINYLHGPSQVEFSTSNEGGGATSVVIKVHARREVNINIVQK